MKSPPPEKPAPRDGTTITVRRHATRRPLAAIVRVVKGSATPPELRLESGSCRVGAGADADIVIEDETVSRSHAELELVPAGVAIRDLGSRNGTYYLGQRIDRLVLAPGSRVTLGRTELQVDADVEALQSSSPGSIGRYGDLIGESEQMRRIFAILTRLEGSLVNVLVEGESGTGKELIARALHENSSVSHGPFIAINCAEMDRALVRSELFGHRKGAFTGASESRMGAFEAANGGTLLLDEVGELPLEVQPVLLRALESKRITRVGESNARPVNVRLIAATNRNLDSEVQNGSFRHDLYYRLMVVRIQVAPLRERPEDIEVLAQHFAQQLGFGEALSAQVIADLRNRRWPGNVRELHNALQVYAALGTLPMAAPVGTVAVEKVLRQLVDLERPYTDQKEDLVTAFTRTYLEMLLEKTAGNQSQAARLAGLERSYFSKLLAKYRH